MSTNVFTPFTYAQVPETWEILVRDGNEVAAENVEEMEEVEQETESKSENSDTVEDNFEENLDENTIWDSTLDSNLDDIEKKESLNSEENETVETELNQQLGEVIGMNTMFSDIKTAILLPWMDFNNKLKTLANWREEFYWNVDYNVLQIVESEYEAPEWADAVNLASVHSDYPVYFWYESWIVYYHTEADEVHFNEDCRYMFSRFGNLKMIDIAKFDNSNMTNIDYMFAYSDNLNYIMSSDFSFKNSNNIFTDDYNLIWQGWTEYKWQQGAYALIDNASHSWYFWWDYVVMLDSKWGEEIDPQVFSVWEEYNIQELNIERENSIFKWWYTVWWQKWNFEDTVTKPTMLYAKWECKDWYLASIDGNSCVSTDTIVVDSVDWGKITIMKEDIWVWKNWWWNERDQWPCPAGYHVPTMQEWNTLFVSWCENHTKLGDWVCDVRNVERQTWEYGKDFIYLTKNEESIRKFWEEMNLEVKLNSSELSEIYQTCENTKKNDCWWWCYDAEERDEYGCEDLLNEWYVKWTLWGYRTSTPEWNILWLWKSYFWVNSFYPNETSNPLFRSTLDSEKISVRCFADDYTAPDKLVMLDLIDKENLSEYKEFEQKIRSWEIDLPEEKQIEISTLWGMDQQQNILSKYLYFIDSEIEYSSNEEDLKKLQDLKSLLEDVMNASDDNKSELIERVKMFNWDYDNQELLFAIIYELWAENFSDYLEEIELTPEYFNLSSFTGFENWLKNNIDDLFVSVGCFSEEEKNDIYWYFEELWKALKESDSSVFNDELVNFLEDLHYWIESLLTRHEDEIWDATVYRYKNMFSFIFNLTEAALLATELDEFVEEAKNYLWTQDRIREDWTIDYKELVIQEYLQEEFVKMWYRMILTPDMTAKQIREKIANIKGISLEDDEYLALFDVNWNEINIDGWIKQNSRWYVGIKKIKKEEWKWRSGGWWGGGWSLKKADEDTNWSAEDSQKSTQDDKNTENVIQNETKWSEEASNTLVDSSDKSSEWQEILSPSDSSFTKEQKDAYTFAKENWITTKDTIQSAQMNEKLTRIAMAKMLSQYAINVLWKAPDTSQYNKFKDVSDKKDADYDNWVTLAYQLWIMWQNMPNNKFRPNDEVNRAEFAAALSRMLYNTSDWEYKSTSKYYIHHMEKLVSEWIITKSDPKMKERRWYVMIMLMRSAK